MPSRPSWQTARLPVFFLSAAAWSMVWLSWGAVQGWTLLCPSLNVLTPQRAGTEEGVDMLACGWQHALMPALLGCSSAVPRSPLYMLQSLSAFVSCHCNHPKKKLLIGANLLQPMTGARCTLWWVRWRCKTGLKKILWSSFLSLASALAQRCCRKDGNVPLLRPLEPTVPPTPETSADTRSFLQ